MTQVRATTWVSTAGSIASSVECAGATGAAVDADEKATVASSPPGTANVSLPLPATMSPTPTTAATAVTVLVSIAFCPPDLLRWLELGASIHPPEGGFRLVLQIDILGVQKH